MSNIQNVLAARGRGTAAMSVSPPNPASGSGRGANIAQQHMLQTPNTHQDMLMVTSYGETGRAQLFARWSTYAVDTTPGRILQQVQY